MELSREIYKQTLGKKIKALRDSLGLSQLQVSFATGISPKTLYSIESGRGNYGVDHLLALSEFYVLELRELADISLQNPAEPELRKNISVYHQDKGSNAHLVLRERPTIVYALSRKLLQTDFLDEFREVKDIRKYCIKKHEWSYISSSITNALETLHEQGLIEIAKHPTKMNTNIYRKVQGAAKVNDGTIRPSS